MERQGDEHTYLTGQTPGTCETSPWQLEVVGANGRRLIAHWSPDGLYVGGCLVASRENAEALARFITREADE